MSESFLFEVSRELLSEKWKRAPNDTEYYRWRDSYDPIGVALNLIDPKQWRQSATSAGYYYQAGEYLEDVLIDFGLNAAVQWMMRDLHRSGLSQMAIASYLFRVEQLPESERTLKRLRELHRKYV